MKRSRATSSSEAPSKRGRKPGVEGLEARLCLAAGAGVDALALGDVNGDRVVDFAVATHGPGGTRVTIYSGAGQAGATATGSTAKELVSIADPLGPGAGRLDLTLGDFDGNGVSDLAVASTRADGRARPVATWSFRVQGDSPINAPVTAVPLSAPFVPQGFRRGGGMDLGSADLDGDGRDELLVGHAGPGDHDAAAAAFELRGDGSGWDRERTFAGAPIRTGRGVSLDAGDVTGDGVPDVALGSKADGRTAVLDGALDRWVWTARPLQPRTGSVRVAVVASEHAPGSLVVTGLDGRGAARAAIVPFAGAGAAFRPVESPGPGALVPLGGGYVYQRSTIRNPQAAFPTSAGPVTPTVLLAATAGAGRVVVQGFDAHLAPSPADTYVEALGAGGAFTPLAPQKDRVPTGLDPAAPLETNLVVYPDIAYHSPYRIDLSGAPAGIYEGLSPYTAITTTPQDGWGPAKLPNVPPTVPRDAGNDWLRQRVIAAYASAIGADYQHHHDPRWLPAQGSPWNLVSTVGYQSQGVDCTNYTAWAYADALGVTLNSDTQQQADITRDNPNGTIIPDELADRVAIQTITRWSGYDDLVAQLVPGDILILNGNPADPAQATHAITWLGDYATDTTGKDAHLIIDSTGITPPHVDSLGRVVPEGVQIRPFGAPGSINDWYYQHVSHVLRLVKDPRTALAPIAGSALPGAAGDDARPLDGDKVVDAMLVLRRRTDDPSRPSLESLALKPLDERAYLSRPEFAARYGASPADLAEVAQWAASQDLEVASVDAATRIVRLRGRVSALSNAFGVRLESGIGATGDTWSYRGEISIPEYLHGVILGVFGVTSDPDGAAASGGEPAGEGRPLGAASHREETPEYTPPDLAARYDFPDSLGAGQTVGVIELSGVIDAQTREDFRIYFESLGIPLPEIVSVGTGTPTTINELELDLETIAAIVPEARTVAYFGALTPGDFLATIQAALHDDAHRIDVLSISYAYPEKYLSKMYLDVASEAFLEGAVMGVTTFASAGDYGSSRDIADGLAHVEFPSVSPWVTSTGGTSLEPTAPRTTERVWNNYEIVDGYLIGVKGSTGGGVSEHFDVPDYQREAGLDPRSVNPGHRRGRGGPDVASIADPHTGIWIYSQGRFFNDGGTSAAAPAWAGLTARLNQLLGKNVGFFNPLLYGPLRDTGALFDVTEGDNISSHIDLEGNQIPTYLGYHAREGWDMTTGWGSPVGQILLRELRRLLGQDG